MSMVKKWGNSASVRIPASVMEAAQVRLDQAVDVSEVEGRIVISPIRQPNYDLDTLLDEITDENLHGAIDMGPAVGNEVW